MGVWVEEEKVSILVAIYNVEKFVEKCISSIVNQTYENIEIILVDDCSKDQSGAICDAFARQDSRIRVFHLERNSKLPAVRNTGLDNATGDYIVFVDGDDWLAEDYVEYMLSLMHESKADIAFSRNHFTTRDDKQIAEDYVEIWSPEKATAEVLFPHLTVGAWNKIYRRNFIEEHHLRFKDLFTAEGFRFVTDATQRANHIVVGARKVYWYRLNNAGSATTKPDVRQGTQSLYALEGIERDLLIRTDYVMSGIREHYWNNYFYTLRLILATNSRRENRELYQNCIRYLHKNKWEVRKGANSTSLAVKMIMIGCIPTVIARYSNKKAKRRLQLDIQTEKENK